MPSSYSIRLNIVSYKAPRSFFGGLFYGGESVGRFIKKIIYASCVMNKKDDLFCNSLNYSDKISESFKKKMYPKFVCEGMDVVV